MKWYSIKKYKPILDLPCLIITDKHKIQYARYGYHEESQLHGWIIQETSHIVTNYVTHFAIADPVEVEE